MHSLDQIDLKSTPFARRETKILLVMKDSSLFLGLRPTGPVLPFEQMFGSAGISGIMRFSVVDNENELPVTINAGAFITELITNAGYTRFTLDKDSNALRIEGNVPQLRISGETARGSGSLRLPDGAETTRGGRLVYKVSRGSFTFDDTWVQASYSNVPPCIDVKPDKGLFDLAIFELPPDIDPPALTKSFEECAEENEADFQAFRKTLIQMDDFSAYALWIASPKVGSIELAEESYLFSDPLAAAERVLASAEAGKSSVVPKFASAALRLINANMIDDLPNEFVCRLKAALQESLNWWNKYRFDTLRGQYFYAYRSETGEENPRWFGNAPVYHHGLQGRLSELSAAIDKLS